MDKLTKFAFKGVNNKCFICNQQIPRFVCLDFSTFLCKECAGVHRKLNYTVKSLGADKLSDSEIKNIINFGGNKKAHEKYISGPLVGYPKPDTKSAQKIQTYIEVVFGEKKIIENSDVDKKNDDGWNPFG